MLDFEETFAALGSSGGGSEFTIKTLAYTGTGSSTNTITFPEKPFMVLGITQDPMDDDKWKRNIIPFIWAYSTAEMSMFWSNGSSHSLGGSCTRLTLTDTSMSWTAEDNTQAFNISNTTYTVYYI